MAFHAMSRALSEIAARQSGTLEETAAAAALTLAPGIDGIAKDLIRSKKTSLIAMSILALSKAPSPSASKYVEELLDAEDSDTRRLALLYFTRTCRSEEIEIVLERYLEKPVYYYNVVFWLDRILYAPARLRAAFLGMLGYLDKS